jgi:Flp pilus assembly protein TadG
VLRAILKLIRRADSGASLLETALVVPMLLLLLTGAVDLGRAYRVYIAILNATREGARAGAGLPCYNGNTSQKQAYRSAVVAATQSEAAGEGIALAAANITLIPDPQTTGCAGRGNSITVRASYRFNTILGQLMGMPTLTIYSQTRMLSVGNDQGG